MSSIEPPDSHHLSAASGWLDLGNTHEAAAELEHVSPARQGHPAVLEVRWRILAEEKSWSAALDVAQELVAAAPEEPSGWIDQAFALHELDRTREAWELLLPMAKKFPKMSIIAYNLACYACQLQQPQEARQWLAKAAALRGQEEIQRLALCDKDLKPLWPEIRQW
jgi:predicted Zn-dependent protease